MGSNNPPEDFVILQLDGKSQGLRLSRLDTSQRDQLTNTLDAAGKLTARGLMIFNTVTGAIEFFDGSDWKGLSQAPSFGNGIRRDTGTGNVELGGELRENTIISQGQYPMNFTTNGGVFSVNSNAFTVNNTNVASTDVDFTVNDGTKDVFEITRTPTGNQIDATVGTSGLSVNNGALSVADGVVTIAGTGGTFNYKNGTLANGNILYSDANGTAGWGALTASTEIKPFNITRNQTAQTSNGASQNTDYINSSSLVWTGITSDLPLTKGKWLLAGMCYTYTYNSATTGTNNAFIWIRITQKNGSVYTPLFTTASLPELKSASTAANGGAYSATQIMYILDVPSDASYRVEATTKVSNTHLVAYWTGTSSIKAIKVGQ